MITASGQVEVRGLLLGPGTPYIVEAFDGLTSRRVRRADLALAGAHGSAGGGRRSAEQASRPVLVTLTADSFDDWDEFDDACTALLTAWQLADVETSVSYRESGTRIMRVYGFTDAVNEGARTDRQATYLLELVCVDPLRYTDEAEQVTVNPGDTVTVANIGNVASSRWSASFAPGSTGARLAHENSRDVDFDGSTIAVDPYIADGRERTVTQDDTRVLPTEASRWFDVEPGENDLTYTVDAGAGALTFQWRSAWL